MILRKTHLPTYLGAGLFGFSIFLWITFPGFMTTDSFIQFGQALSNEHTNWHPPLMAWVWNKLLYVFPGTLGITLIQGIAFWVALSLLAQNFYRKQLMRGLLFIFGIGIFPTFFLHPALAWKDIGQGCFYLLGFACTLQISSIKNFKWIWSTMALLFLFYGFCLRHNSIFSVYPLLCFFIFSTLDQLHLPLKILKTIRPLKTVNKKSTKFSMPFLIPITVLFTMLSGFFLTTGFALIQWFIAINLTPDSNKTGVYVIFLRDLTSLSVSTNQNLLPPYILNSKPEAHSISTLKEIYDSGPDGVLDLGYPELKSQRIELTNAWKQAAMLHPVAFIQRRFQVWFQMLGTHGPINGLMIGQDRTHPLVPIWNPGSLSKAIANFYLKTSRSFLFLPGLYLIIILICLWKVRSPVTLTLGLSGLMHSFGYLLAANAPDFRYHWWTVLCAAIIVTPFAIQFVFSLCVRFSRTHGLLDEA